MTNENKRNAPKLVLYFSLIGILIVIALSSNDIYSAFGTYIVLVFVIAVGLYFYSGTKKTKDGVPLRLLRESEIQTTDYEQTSKDENNITRVIVYTMLIVIGVLYLIITNDGDIFTVARNLTLDIIVISLFAVCFESRRDRRKDKVPLNPIVYG